MVTLRHCWSGASWACQHRHREGHLRRASPTPAFPRVVAALSVSAALVLAACRSAGGTRTPAAAQGSVGSLLGAVHGVQLVVTGTSNEARPELPAEGRALLAGLQAAGRHPGHTLVVISSSLDTADPLALRAAGRCLCLR